MRDSCLHHNDGKARSSLCKLIRIVLSENFMWSSRLAPHAMPTASCVAYHLILRRAAKLRDRRQLHYFHLGGYDRSETCGR